MLVVLPHVSVSPFNLCTLTRYQLTEGPVGRTLRPHISSDAWESLAEEPTSPLDAEMLTMFFGALRERELAAFSEKQVRPHHALPWSSTIALVAVV